MPFHEYSAHVRVSQHLALLTEPLRYSGQRQSFIVPAGFVTDFASVPRWVTWLVPTLGSYTLAAILHDWLCTVGITAGIVTSRDADGIFRRVAREEGTGPVTRWLLWTGVRWGALLSRRRRTGWWRDALPVLVLSALILRVATAAVHLLDRLVHHLIGAP